MTKYDEKKTNENENHCLVTGIKHDALELLIICLNLNI